MDISRMRRRVRLRDLDTLMAVVQTGGVRKAAQHLHLSQPAVSKAVRELEDSLGVTLLDRSRRGIEVTPFGQALVKRTKAVFDELQGALRDLEHLADPQGGEVHLGCMETLQAGLVGAAVAQMSERYPRIRFEIEGGQANELIEHFVRERVVEFAIARPYGELPADMTGEPLFHDRLKVVVGQAHPLAKRRRVSLGELVDERWVLSRNEVMPHAPLVRACTEQGLPLPTRRVVTGSLPMRYSLLSNAGCVTLMPHSVLPFAQHSSPVRVLPVELPAWETPTMVITLKSRTLAPVARRFVDQVKELANQLRNG